MKRLTRLLLWIFAILAITDIVFVYLRYDTLRYASKSLLVPVLFLAYVAETRLQSPFSKLLGAALFFCWLGDVSLLFANLFLAGLVMFLLAHILFIIYTLRIRGKGLLNFQPLAALPVLVYWILFSAFLSPYLDKLKIPVMIYAAVICTFLSLTLNLFWKVHWKIAVLFFCGAGQFVLSDSLLAANRFIYPFPFAGEMVMLTYCSALFLIVKGSMHHTKMNV